MVSKRRNVLLLGFASLFNDASNDMIFPILPLFLSNVLGAPAAVIGLIEGIAQSALSFLQVISGYVSDRLRMRKLIVLAGYTVSTLVRAFLPAATHWGHVLGVRLFDRVGKGVRDAPRDAIIAESVAKKIRGRAFGLQRATDTTGAVIGTIAATVLLALAFSFREIFWIAVPPAILSIFAVALTKEVRPRKVRKLPKFKINHKLRKFFTIAAIFAFANFSYAFFILRAQGIGVALLFIPVLYLIYNIFYAAFSYPAGRLSDRVGRRNALAFGYGIFALTAAGFATIANPIFIWPLFALYGIQIAFTDAVSRAYVSDLVKSVRRATALGAYQTTVGIVALPASFVAGLIWDIAGPAMTFSVAAALAGLAMALLLGLMKKR